jgi:hypothetical protein
VEPIAISQLKDFNWEIGMNASAQFRQYAGDCETMSKVSRDPETKAVWKRMAERWLLCAKYAEHEDEYQRRQLEEKRSKPHRNPHAWEGMARQA